jgi:hypothetical protein
MKHCFKKLAVDEPRTFAMFLIRIMPRQNQREDDGGYWRGQQRPDLPANARRLHRSAC